MFYLVSQLLRHISHYSAILPYNLNWRNVNWDKMAPLLTKNPIHVIDIGARGQSPEELDPLKKYIDYVGFDADEEEAKRLLASPPTGFRSFKVLPYFIGSETGRKTFYIYKSRGHSSALLPNPAYHRFAQDFSIERETTVATISIDELALKGQLSDVDVLKIDTQGTEYDILSAASWALDHALMVEVEVEFLEMYLGQKLFFEVCRLMHEKGFDLLYLNRVFANRTDYHGSARGQMMFGDALFGLREDRVRNLSLEKKAKYVVLLIQYGNLDFAHAIYSDSAELRAAYPQLRGYFHANRGPLSKIKRGLSMQLDKLIALLLHMRGTNCLPCDSDRSWPVR